MRQRSLRRRILQFVFLFLIPGLMMVFACALVATLANRPSAPLPITEAELEGTIQARVDAILSDRPLPTPAPADAPAAPSAAASGDLLTNIVNGLASLVVQGFALFGLAGIGEGVAQLILSTWAFVSGLGIVAQALCCCLLPLALLLVFRLVSEVLGGD